MTGTGGEKIQTGLKAFKYYIHDTAQGYALQIAGPFTQACVSEVAACWETAKPTLGGRKLTLDVRQLTSLDEFARQWLAGMVQQGALCVPESVLRSNATGVTASHTRTATSNLLLRLSNAVRGFHQTKTVNTDSARVTGR